MHLQKLPLRFIGLWILNLIILLALGIRFGVNTYLLQTNPMFNTKALSTIYLVLGGILAGVEDWLIDKRKNNT